MSNKLGVLILRAQPLHAGHRDLIRQALKQCVKLILLIGSANSPRTIKNPWSFAERKIIITDFLIHEEIRYKVSIYPLNDYVYSDAAWMSDVTSIINSINDVDKVVLFGHHKDGNNYLHWFPQYTFQHIESTFDVNATGIREKWLKNQPSLIPDSVNADYAYYENERAKFANYPHPETLNFNCADPILECSGHVLLIKRKIAPGAGTWALPGGFKNANETFIDCAIRELKEETNVRVPEKILRGSIVATQLFDSPYRGNGIPRNTLAVHIRVDLNSDGSLPRVSPQDDAVQAEWFPIETVLNTLELFDDHMGILTTMCKVMPLPAHLNPRF